MNVVGKTGCLCQPKAAMGGKLEGWKRTLDVVCIVLALPVLVPLLLMVGAAVWILSPGPVLFRQERIGYRGQRFECLKFRTMKVNAESTGHQQHLEQLIRSNTPMVKLDTKGDARLIRFGRVFRATGLDELPQLFNVVRGEMSLVGPRPCLAYEYERYEPWQKQRFDALPGLTGLWQVSGKNKTTFTEMMEMDVWYAHHKSLVLDLKILLKTMPAVLEQAKDMALRGRQQPAVVPLGATPPKQQSVDCK
jgi:exopolysaccharide production protein ExoY